MLLHSKLKSPSAPTQSHSSPLSPVGRRVGWMKCDLQWYTREGSVHGPTASQMGEPTCERGVMGRENVSKPGILQFPGSGRQIMDTAHPHMGPSLSNPHQWAGRTSMGSLQFRRSNSFSEGWGLCWSSSSFSHLPKATTTYTGSRRPLALEADLHVSLKLAFETSG